MTYLKTIHKHVSNLNSSKYFAGICMIMLNIGSKYVTIELSENQEMYLRNSMARQMLLFSIAWVGTRDIYISLIITTCFVALTQYIFNEKSNYCILPKKVKKLYNIIDKNKDNVISNEELDDAIRIIKKAQINNNNKL
jgi:hypothetical protein